MIEELDKFSLFKDLSLAQLEDILPFCTKLDLDEGDIMIEEGNKDDRDLYLLISGNVEIVSSDSSVLSHEVVLSREDKEIFGEISWLSEHKRTASVRCKTSVDAVRIDGIGLMSFLDKNPEIGFLVMQRIACLLAQRIEETDTLMKQILWNTVI
ncbi:MAG: cyclic nucleotide-binding domain-containing protein [Gammaproteobacteria bacterium]|nr:cyclic nucleotide-binding domain-containing protein [Gammaproteobacteria bacterium]MDH5594264.1 cyclic nucleotide-binding domain-containing protein [Gammaproteobacteria bacterium]MDH5614643.1 cyclic nucleotide-binding domain-containing protein [Gammaproteobacteria bacterium]